MPLYTTIKGVAYINTAKIHTDILQQALAKMLQSSSISQSSQNLKNDHQKVNEENQHLPSI